MIWIVLRKKFGCSGAEFYLEYFELAQVSDLHKRFQIHHKISFMVDLNRRDISGIRCFFNSHLSDIWNCEFKM